MLNGEAVRVDSIDLEDQVCEIRNIATFLAHACKELVTYDFTDPYPYQNGLMLCFGFLDGRLESLDQSIRIAKETDHEGN